MLFFGTLADQTNLNTEIDELRSSVKRDIAKLHKFRPSDLASSVVDLALRDTPKPGSATGTTAAAAAGQSPGKGRADDEMDSDDES